MKLERTIQTGSFVAVLAAVVTLMLVAPTIAKAHDDEDHLTIKHVRVTLVQTSPAWRAVYCDTGLGASCGEAVAVNGNAIWTPARGFPLTGIKLDEGDTLVLTQTGLVTTAAGTGGNFDTSDAVHGNGSLQDCQPARPCATKIEIDTGAGLVTVFNQASGLNPLTAFNHSPGHNPVESSQYQEVTPLPAAVVELYTLHLGYADNVHGPCPAAGCFPSPFNGTHGTHPASVFVGLGGNINPSACPPANRGFNCFDGGAILITALDDDDDRDDHHNDNDNDNDNDGNNNDDGKGGGNNDDN